MMFVLPHCERVCFITGRGPNTAVPTRTSVDPSAMAISMSPVMPIDNSVQLATPAA